MNTKHTPWVIPTLTDDTRCAIKTQKAVTRNLLKKLQETNWNAIVAGGAPRNWYFNTPANDIDVFIELRKLKMPQYSNNKMYYPSQKILEGYLEKVMDIKDIFNVATHSAKGVLKDTVESMKTYQSRMEGIHSVFEGVFEGQRVQLIFLNQGEKAGMKYVMDSFDTSINMAVTRLIGDTLHTDYSSKHRDSMETGCIFVYPNGNCYESKHLKKIAEYYPNAPLISYRARAVVVKNPESIKTFKKSWEVLEMAMKKEKENREGKLDSPF